MKTHLYSPFLISRSYELDYRTIVVPRLLIESKCSSLLIPVTDITDYEGLTPEEDIKITEQNFQEIHNSIKPAYQNF